MEQERNSGRFVALDGLRGVAAIAVMFRHSHVAGAEFVHGHLAVDLFFMLSGFVIAKSYEGSLRDGRMSVTGYMLIRLERLYPLLLLGGLIGLALWAGGFGLIAFSDSALAMRAAVGQFLLVPFLAPGFFFAFNNAHWSIFFELLANLIHALALPRLGTRALAAIVAVSAVGLAVAARHFGTLDVGWTATGFVWGLPRVGFGFFGGVLLWRTRLRWSAHVRPWPLALLALILLAATGAPLALTGTGNGFGLFELALVLLLFPPLVMAASAARGGAVANALGTMSFPLYAIHKPIVEAMIVAHIDGPARWAGLALLVAAAWALGRYVDEPLNAARRARRKVRG